MIHLRLTLGQITNSTAKVVCVTFVYHMWGRFAGRLVVERDADNKLWEIRGDQGDGWRTGQFEVENPAQVHCRNGKYSSATLSTKYHFVVFGLIF